MTTTPANLNLNAPRQRIGLLAIVSTMLLVALMLSRMLATIPIGPVGNIQRLLTVIFITWAIMSTLLRGRIKFPLPLFLLLVPGAVMMVAYRTIDPALTAYPLLLLAILNVRFSFRSISQAAILIIILTASFTMIAISSGVNIRPDKWTNLENLSRIESAWHWLFETANQPAQTVLLSLPIVVMARQRMLISRSFLFINIALVLATLLMTESRSTIAAGIVFVGILTIDLPRSLHNAPKLAIRLLILTILLATFLIAILGSSRWMGLRQVSQEVAALVADENLAHPPMARSVIAAASISVSMKNPLLGVGPEPHEATNRWAKQRGLTVHTRSNVKQDSEQGGVNIHGSLAMLAIRTGIPAAAAMLIGIFLFWVGMMRRGHIHCATLFGATLIMLTIAQIGMDHFGKVYCWVTLAILLAHEMRPPLIDLPLQVYRPATAQDPKANAS